MTSTLVVDAFSGMSGDMFLAALIDLGAEPAEIEKGVASLEGLESFRLVTKKVMRGVFSATHLSVDAAPAAGHRHYGQIVEMIETAALPARIQERAKSAFHHLALAEAKVHGMPIERVHFHEVGAVDSIVDIVGAAVALENLGIDRVLLARLKLGRGEVDCQHGRIPVPAPATLEILKGIEVEWSDVPRELVTPTGAALLAAWSEALGGKRLLRPREIGYGAGSAGGEEGAGSADETGPGRAGAPDPGNRNRTHDHHGEGDTPHPHPRSSLPNVVRLVRAELAEAASGERTIAVLESSLDDMSPEHLGWLRERLRLEGALEVFVTPIQMKKDRPGFLLTVLCEEEAVERFAGEIFRHSTTLGLRIRREHRFEMDRRTAEVSTPYGKVTVKVGIWNGTRKVAAEFDSARSLAEARGIPLRDIYRAAEEAWSKENP